jgi:preprotein translocase subunit SecA
MFKKFVRKLFGGNKQERDMRTLNPIITRINEEFEILENLSDEDLKAKTEEFRSRLKDGEGLNDGKSLDDIIPEVYAVMKEACRRHLGKKWEAAGSEITWNMVPFDVQLAGAIALHQGKIAEMATGEGKTLAAIMPLYLNALEGKGSHLITVNDYLAKRDSEWMKPIFEFLGLSVGCILTDMEPATRREMYKCDITYGTNNEFGFDYLRDNMTTSKEFMVQRGHNYAIVDEVDSVLIDEARTPLIISGPVDRSTQRYDLLKPKVEELIQKQSYLVNKLLTDASKLLDETPDDPDIGLLLLRAKKGAPKTKRLLKFLQEGALVKLVDKTEAEFMVDKRVPELEAELYFIIDEKGHSIDLTEKGRVALSPHQPENFVIPDLVDEIAKLELSPDLTSSQKEKMKEEIHKTHEIRSEEIHNISQLLRAYSLFEKDVEYIVQDNKVIIVDEYTGRLMPGRRWSDGLHQAVEAKESVKIEKETQTLATITIQNYFRLYTTLAGMTGTAETEAQEFVHTYGMDVIVMPTNKPIRRIDCSDHIYRTKREKYNAIIEEIRRLNSLKLPVLVGTVSVEVSELLSRMLKRAKISHNVLNAKNHSREAEIIRDAGKPGTITIATNMAGRGTDIKLGEGVVKCDQCCIKCDEDCNEKNECAGIKTKKDYTDCEEFCECGLQIIGTERHESRRIDRQLRGRSGRQGDPGCSQFFISLEDDLMRLFGSEKLGKILDWLGMQEGEEIQHGRLNSYIEKAQQKIESINFGRRKHTLEYDDIMNKQREAIYGLRREILLGELEDLRNIFLDISGESIEEEFNRNFSNGSKDLPDWNLNGFFDWVKKCVPEFNISLIEYDDGSNFDDILPLIMKQVKDAYNRRIEIFGEDMTKNLSRAIMLRFIDMDWQDHLLGIDELREGIHLRAYAQRDPLIEYQREATELFYEMMYNINKEIFSHLFHAQITVRGESGDRQMSYQKDQVDTFTPQEESGEEEGDQGRGPVKEAPKVKHQPFRRQGKKIKPNEPCPCGSGKKYKKCCGKRS